MKNEISNLQIYSFLCQYSNFDQFSKFKKCNWTMIFSMFRPAPFLGVFRQSWETK